MTWSRAAQRFAVGYTRQSQARGASSPPVHVLIRQGCDEWVTYCNRGPATPEDGIEIRAVPAVSAVLGERAPRVG